jgi:predicted 3-demethylubiquinone-9 3-methyltransferase (glyoxalase superfamily)
MQKIIPYLWFDKEAVEAAHFYTSIFPNSRVKGAYVLNNTPSGSVDMVTFEILGREIQAISAGPVFQFNPSISFHVTCNTEDEVDTIWEKLSEGGTALVPLGKYPFSDRFGWVQDKYGLSWQITSTGGSVPRKLTPVLMFVGSALGKAEEAVKYWTSVFLDSKVDSVTRYGKGELPDQEGSLKYAAFTLSGEEFGAMDSAQPHQFAFNEAISFMVNCEDQEEIDYFWNKLSAVPEAEQCGWLKDKFGVSWQIVPANLENMLKGDDQQRIARVTEAFLQMKKFDLAELQAAYEGK